MQMVHSRPCLTQVYNLETLMRTFSLFAYTFVAYTCNLQSEKQKCFPKYSVTLVSQPQPVCDVINLNGLCQRRYCSNQALKYRVQGRLTKCPMTVSLGRTCV